MGLYATVASLEAEYGVKEIRTLSNIGVNSGSATTYEDRVNAVIVRQEAIANSFLSRYLNDGSPNPLLTNPIVITIVHRLVRKALDQQDSREGVYQDYQEAMKWLMDIQSGKMNLGLTALGTKQGAVESSMSASNETGAFTQERLNGYTDNGQLQRGRGRRYGY
jgi:phage gp36-like protein